MITQIGFFREAKTEGSETYSDFSPMSKLDHGIDAAQASALSAYVKHGIENAKRTIFTLSGNYIGDIDRLKEDAMVYYWLHGYWSLFYDGIRWSTQLPISAIVSVESVDHSSENTQQQQHQQQGFLGSIAMDEQGGVASRITDSGALSETSCADIGAIAVVMPSSPEDANDFTAGIQENWVLDWTI